MTEQPSSIAFVLAACFIATLASVIARAGGDPPPALRGVLLITVDTLRADHVNGYGEHSLTPGLQRLASGGVLVENAFTPTPSTGPAHASLFTGVHPWKHRVLNNAVPLGSRFATLAEIARAQGFTTAAIVSSFILDPRFGMDRGFDRYHFEPSRSSQWRGKFRKKFYSRGDETTRKAIATLTDFAASGDGGRFFLWVHYFDPHFPYEPPAAYQLAVDSEIDMQGKSPGEKVSSLAELEMLNRRYRGEVRYVDAQIDRLLMRLQILGLNDQTAVVLTADHGEGLGDHAHLGHGVNLFNELIRVPLLVRAPGIPPGRRLAGPAQLEDLLPTLASLMGAPAPENIDGVDLLPWLRGDANESPRRAAIGRRKTYDDKPVLFYEWKSAKKWIGELDAEGTIYDSQLRGRERRLEGSTGASAWLREKIGDTASSIATESRPEIDSEVEQGLRALGYIE